MFELNKADYHDFRRMICLHMLFDSSFVTLLIFPQACRTDGKEMRLLWRHHSELFFGIRVISEK